MKAVGRYIIIENLNEEVESKSGLIMSGSDLGNLRYRKSKVVSVGDLVTCVEQGDIIYCDSRVGHKVKLSNGIFGVITDGDVVIKL